MDWLARFLGLLFIWRVYDFWRGFRRWNFLHTLRFHFDSGAYAMMINRIEARDNWKQYCKGPKALYIRINWWFVKPTPFWYVKIGLSKNVPFSRCDAESGNCVAIGSKNSKVLEQEILNCAKGIYNQTNFGMGPNKKPRAKSPWLGPAGFTESFGNFTDNAEAYEFAKFLIDKFDLVEIEASKVRAY